MEADERSKYLGLPNTLGRNKSVVLGFLKEKVTSRIRSWKDKFFSKPGKEVLIKSVVQSLPTFAMSVFLLPHEINKDIERSLAKFWWDDSKTETRKIHWMSWDRLCKHKSIGGMGFRCFRDFNVAMLGKQAWRLITMPDSLVTKMYRARYFPDASFFEAKLGHNPSFVWRSIWEARDLILAGIRWRVGPGVSISIKGQPWLNDGSNPYIETEYQGLDNQKVCSLLCMDRREWDVKVIKDIFNDRDQICILNTQLDTNTDRDVVYWGKESTGVYSVRSAYKLLQSMKGHWQMGENDKLWSKLWRIKAPPKALNLVWRALSKCMPTMMQLREKHVQVNQVCPVCSVSEETILHSLVTCMFASSCWRIVFAEKYRDPEDNFEDWLDNELNRANQEGKAEIVSVCWSIWKARNEIVWNKKQTSVNRVVALAKQHLIQWKAAQNISTSGLTQPDYEGDGACVWVKPQRNSIKVTVDAAIFEDREEVAVGMVARDFNGELIQAKTRTYQGLQSVEWTEAMAIKEALSWSDRNEWQKVDIESDCLVVLQAIRSRVYMRSPFGQIVESCRSLLRHRNNVTLYFIKRSANRVAHQLARVAYLYSDRSFDKESIPIDVMNCIVEDLSS